MYESFAAKYGAMGAVGLLLLCAGAAALSVSELYSSLRNARRSGRIDVYFFTQLDESLSISQTPIKFWFALVWMFLGFVGAILAFAYFSLQLLNAVV